MPEAEEGIADVRGSVGRVTIDDHIRALGLSQAIEDALTQAGVTTVAGLARLVEHGDLISVDGIDIVDANETEGVLRAVGLYPTLSPCLTGEEHPITGACRVGCLDVGKRVAGVLKRAGTRTITEALGLIERGELLDIRRIGGKAETELRSRLVETGFLPAGGNSDRDTEQRASEVPQWPGAG